MSKSVPAAFLISLLLSAPTLAADGNALYNMHCAACHQPDGAGAPGLAPPLVDEALWRKLGSKSSRYIAGVMLAGLSGTIEVAGQKYTGLVMPPQSALSDEDLAAVGTHVLSTLNHRESKLDAALIGKARAAPLSHASLQKLRKTGN